MPKTPIKIAAILQLENSHGQAILQGIGQFAREHPGAHVVKFSKTGPLTERFLRGLGVRGVIAKVSSRAEEDLLNRLRMPVVNVSGEVATPRLATVNTDDRLLGATVAGYFQQRGFRHVAYCGNETHLASVLRREGLGAQAKRLGLGCQAHVLQREPETALKPGRARRALAAWLKRLPHPVGILAFNDLVAHELVVSCDLCGLRVPEDVAVIGVGNDLTRLGFSAISLSSIELDTRRIGYRAAELLFTRLTGKRLAPVEELVPLEKIVTRRSSDRFAIDDETVARALEHIRDHVGNTLYVADIARAAACAPRTLALRFRKALNTSIYAQVQRLRLDRAAELLTNPKLSVTEIAYATGHEDARHLSIAFKRHYGVPPGKYRRKKLSGSRSAR